MDSVHVCGGGFVLRPWEAQDLESLVMHANDPQVPLGLSDLFPHPYTREHGQAFLNGEVVDLSEPVRAIVVDGQACGGIALRLGQGERAGTAELGYWLGRSHWGRGLMTAVVGRFLEVMVPALDLHRIGACVLDSNPASARVLEKNGFVAEGCQRAIVRKADGLHDLRLFAWVGPR